jgi:ribonucleoside-diphosphate reductase alpha chain
MRAISRAAYLTSADLAAEKGAFALFERAAYLERPHIAAHDKDVQKAIAKHGIRNGCLTSIAPTGTISLFAGNVSSGIEPVFAWQTRRRILDADGATREETLSDFAFDLFRAQHGESAALTPAFVTADELSPHEHLIMQAAVQAHVDSSISKTINCPVSLPFDAFKGIYAEAYRLGLKGCTTYRPNAVTGAVLTPVPAAAAASQAVAKSHPRPLPSPSEHPGDVVYLSRPLERDPVLNGATYKLKWPESDHALYVTINDIEHDSGEPGVPARRRPFEIFINTRNLEHYAWTVALTRMISAVFRRGGDVSFVAEELKAVFDPQGGRWIGGRYVPSLLAAIGDIIETHMRRIGFLTAAPAGPSDPGADAPASEPNWGNGADAGVSRRVAGARGCPRCGDSAFLKRDGCWICQSCGFSRCG